MRRRAASFATVSSFSTCSNVILLTLSRPQLVDDAELITTTSRLRLAEGLGMWASFSGTFSKTLWEGWNKAEGAAMNAARLVVRECRLRLGRDAVDGWLEGFDSLRESAELETLCAFVAGEDKVQNPEVTFRDAKSAIQGKEWRLARTALVDAGESKREDMDLAACAMLAAAEEEVDMIASLALLRAAGSALKGMGGRAPAKLFSCVEDLR